jgi:hypothetical protein
MFAKRPRGKVVNGHDPMALGEQGFGQMAADETGAARDKRAQSL